MLCPLLVDLLLNLCVNIVPPSETDATRQMRHYATVVAIYAPTNTSFGTTQAAAPFDTFYDQLQSVVSAVPPRYMLLVLGDFNAHVGSD